MKKTKQNDQPFFVGYLSTPPALRKFYIPLVILLMVACAFFGYSLANSQKTTGPAQWLTANPQTIQGLIKLQPYPVLHRFNPEAPDEVESILLVAQGKHSAGKFVTDLDGEMVDVTGFPIYRGGWSMLELRSKDDVQLVKTASQAQGHWDRLRSKTQVTSLGEIDFSGEVADSKCFLGVMKPGEGVVHRACAEVCLIGGLPAMLLVEGDDQQRYGYMLTTDEGESASHIVAMHAGDVMQVSGELMQKGSLLYIKIQQTTRL